MYDLENWNRWLSHPIGRVLTWIVSVPMLVLLSVLFLVMVGAWVMVVWFAILWLLGLSYETFGNTGFFVFYGLGLLAFFVLLSSKKKDAKSA
jgi:hypothetical protein